jgi:hypothetical protein
VFFGTFPGLPSIFHRDGSPDHPDQVGRKRATMTLCNMIERLISRRQG